MASRTLLQLFILSIIFTNQIEARNVNKTRHLEKNQEYDIITNSVNKRSDKAKKIYTPFDQRSDTNAESRHDILSRYKYNRKYKLEDNEEAESDKSQAEQQSDDYHKSQTTITSNRIELTSVYNRKYITKESTSSEVISQLNSIDRKLKGVTKLEPNDESSLQKYVAKENHPTVKPDRRQKHLTVRHRNTKIRTTQANRQKQLNPKRTHKCNTDVENEICKTKYCNYKNHRSFEKTSREHDVNKLKRRDEFKTASKDNKKKVNKNNIKGKYRFINNHKSFTRLPLKNSKYEIKYRDIKKPKLSNTMSMENDIYVRKHIDEFATKEEPVSKQVNPEYKPKISQNFQKKKQRNTMIRKVRHTDKAKHHSRKVISNQEKYKPALEENRNSVSDETHTDIRKGENERNTNPGDTFKPDDADCQTLENQDEKETLESYQSENNFLNMPSLPFYVSSTTKRDKKEKFKKQPKKDEMETDILVSNPNIKNQVEEETPESYEELSEENNFLNKPRMLFYISSTTKRVIAEMFEKLAKKQVSQKDEMETDILLSKPNIKKQDEKETLESREELFNENSIPNKPRLSSTTKMVINEKNKKQPKKLASQKDDMETDILLGNLNTVLKGKSDLANQNIDLNTTINRLASSKILDFITDRVAGRMLQKLEKSLASNNNLRKTELYPEKVEQIDIMFKKDGDMVMMGRDPLKEKNEDEYGLKDSYYPY